MWTRLLPLPLHPRSQGALVGFAVAAAIIGGGYGARTLTEGGATTRTSTRVEAQNHVLILLNARRAAAHLKPLRADPILQSLAREHSRDEIRGDYFAHDAPLGQTFYERAAYLHRRVVGETIAWGTGSFGTARGIVSLWMSSPEHRRIILTPAMRRVGIAVLRGPYQNQNAADVATADYSS